MTAAEEKKAFKDWFDKDAARLMSEQLASVYKPFQKKKFCKLALAGIEQMEFNQRVGNFAYALAQTLPAEYPAAIKIICDSLPAPLPDCESVTDGWLQWPIGQFIADYGLNHFDESMHAMTELTRRFSAEYAVRPFVEKYPADTFAHLQSLCSHECPHVRRWCSEGTRTRLPWGRKLTQLIDDPSPIWPILEALKDDPELYVRRSVANNLNDLSKDHVKLVLARVKKWRVGASDDRKWIIKHGLRSLIKQGDSTALAAVGYGRPTQLKVDFSLSPSKIAIGDSVRLHAKLINGGKKPQPLLVDYVVHYVRKARGSAAGKKTSSANKASDSKQPVGEKVFKWKSLTIEPGDSLQIDKKHSMKATTIRALYPGVHKVEIQINGFRIGDDTFKLTG